MSTMASKFVVIVLLVICAEFPRSHAAVDCSSFLSPKTVVYNKEKSVDIIWKCTTTDGSSVYASNIERYQIDGNSQDNTKVYIGSHDFIKKETLLSSNVYKFEAKSNGNNIDLKLTIPNVKDQINNKDGTVVNVMTYEYMFICTLTYSGGKFSSKEIKLRVFEKPKITSELTTKYISTNNQKVTLKCSATGNPTPNITWYILKNGNLETTKSGNELIDQMSKEDAGIYKCVAKNGYGEDSDKTSVQYTDCSTGCSSKEDIAIRWPDLNYDDGYGDEDNKNYKTLIEDTETECMETSLKLKIYSCVVSKLRRGSVVADIKLTYSSTVNDPAKPLRDAIETGTFAGHSVTKSFVSPTSAPTDKPTPSPTEKGLSTGPPDAGQRGQSKEGLSSGAIIAIVVVFTIIFIIIIVVLIVCMVKRRKPAGSSKPYKEDGAYKATTAAPLKAQPYKEDPYDNGSDKLKEVVYADLNFQDRYPNGGGPPPQYTPSSNYAEVQPSPGEQDESQVEWDKSVKDEMWI